MKNNTIQITDSVMGVVVPVDINNPFIDNGMQYLIYNVPNYKNWVSDKTLSDYGKLQKYLRTAKEGEDWKRGGCKLPDGNWQIHGICKLPELQFDFIYGTGSYDTMTLKSRIQRAIIFSGIDIKYKNLLIISKNQ